MPHEITDAPRVVYAANVAEHSFVVAPIITIVVVVVDSGTTRFTNCDNKPTSNR